MRRLFHISALILLYFLCTAKSCERDEQSREQEEAWTAAEKDSIAGAFATDRPDNQVLKAFEETAKLKMYDFRDYLKLLTDTSTGDVFNSRVVEMIGDLFISREVHLNLLCGIKAAGNENLNARLKQAGFTNFKIPPGMLFDSIFVILPLQQVNDTMYSGKLGCRIYCTSETPSDIAIKPGKDKVINFFLVKREKTFGHNSLKVWSALLGDID